MTAQTRTLYRSRNNRMIAGVCGGLGDFFGIDPTIIRILFALGLIFGHVFVAVLYLVMFIVVPEAPLVPQPVTSPIEERESTNSH